MQRAAADDLAIVLQHHEITDVLANLRQRARQQGAVGAIRANQRFDRNRIGEFGFTRTHGPPPSSSRHALSPLLMPVSHTPAQFRPAPRDTPIPPAISSLRRIPHPRESRRSRALLSTNP